MLEKSLAASASVATPAGEAVDASLAYSRSASLAKLYEQTERTLFLQFALYRLCESHANGALSGTCDLHAKRYEHALKNPNAGVTPTTAFHGYAQCLTRCAALKKPLQTAETAATADRAQFVAAEKALAVAEKDEAKRLVLTAEIELLKRQLKKAEPSAKPALQTKLDAKENQKAGIPSDLKQKKESYETRRLTLAQARKAVQDASKTYRRCLGGLRDDYSGRFTHIIQASIDLHELDVKRAEADAKKAKSEADKAKSEAKTAAAKAQIEVAKEKSKAASKALEELQDKALEGAIKKAFEPTTQNKAEQKSGASGSSSGESTNAEASS